MDEDIPVESFQSICRTCFVHNGLILIENVSMEGSTLESMIKTCTNIDMKLNRNLPQQMCRDCIYKVCTLNTFLKLCKNSEELLNRSWNNKFEVKRSNSFENGQVETIIIINNDFEILPNNDINDNSIESHETVPQEDEALERNENDELILQEEDDYDDVLLKEETVKQIVLDDHNDDQCTDLDDNLKNIPIKEENIEISPKRPGLIFNCDYCNLQFEKLIELRLHKKKTGHRSRKHKCTFCIKKFVSVYKLREHIRTHTFENQLICKICNKGFSHKATFNRHLLCHSEEKTIVCAECGAAFKRPESLRCHERKLHGREKLLCTFCGKEFNNESGYSHHRRAHLGKIQVQVDPENPKQCKQCGKVYSTESVLEEHIKKRHSFQKSRRNRNANKTKCAYCKVDFKTEEEITSHRLNSSCSELYPKYHCINTDCNRIFFSKVALYKHSINDHIKEEEEGLYYEYEEKSTIQNLPLERKFFCDICGNGFYKKYHLKNHVLKHTGIKSFTCEICDKSFALKRTLTAHYLTHTHEKPFSCEICCVKFKEIRSLRRHYKNVHSTDDSNDFSESLELSENFILS